MVSITKYLFRPGVQLQFWVLLGVKPRIELTVGNFSFAPATTTSSEDHPSVQPFVTRTLGHEVTRRE